MSDLTERLREMYSKWSMSGGGPAILTETADEIDRLTVALAEVQKDRDYWKVEAEGERAKVAFRDKRLAEAIRERDNAQLAYEAMRDHRALKEKP